MNYVKSCLIITMLVGVGFSQPCDEETFNVLDIVALANCVLAENCNELPDGWGECMDMNSDGMYNVLDIVLFANCVLAGNCWDL